MKRCLILLMLLVPLSASAQNVGSTKFVTASPVCDTNIYASGDTIGGKLTFSSTFRQGVNTGYIVSVNLIDKAAQAVNLDLVLFDSNPTLTTFTDQAALDIDDADLSKVVAVISLATATTSFAFADNSTHYIGSLFIPIRGIDSSGSPIRTLYGVLVSRGTPTFATSSDLTVKLGIAQD